MLSQIISFVCLSQFIFNLFYYEVPTQPFAVSTSDASFRVAIDFTEYFPCGHGPTLSQDKGVHNAQHTQMMGMMMALAVLKFF